jgi:23S rRNA (uracil1939-C5)-methyltransferase
MEINDLIELTIHDITSHGWGVGRFESGDGTQPVVFVDGAAPGERVSARITDVKKNHFIGELVKVIDPSPQRRQPPCPYFDICPGCSLQFISYDAQFDARVHRVSTMLERAAGDHPLTFETVKSPEEFGYRTHISIKCEHNGNDIRIGFTDPATKRVVDIPSCLLIPEWATTAYNKLRNRIIGLGKALPPRFQLRLFIDHDERVVYPVAPRGPLKRHREFPSLLSEVLEGFPAPKTLKREMLGVVLRIHPASFVQANYFLAHKLYGHALGLVEASESDTVLEMYSGTGFFTLSLGPVVKEAVALESDSRACDNLEHTAVEMAEAYGKNYKFRKTEPSINIVQGKAEELTGEVINQFKPTIVIANPPRSGFHRKALDQIVASDMIKRIIIISCDPSTCARDMRLLIKGGFVPDEAVLIDQYPQTAHMECIVRLTR